MNAIVSACSNLTVPVHSLQTPSIPLSLAMEIMNKARAYTCCDHH